MKVLFLDVDGVLNNDTTKERCLQYVGVDKQLAELLVNWLKTTNIKIVLSSTWRNFPEMHFALKDEGIDWISITPYVSPEIFSTGRGSEISVWLAEHPEVEAYAVLDDNKYDILVNHKDAFVQTDPRVGLTVKDIDRLKKIFN